MADPKDIPPDPPEPETPIDDAALGADHPDDKRDTGTDWSE